MNTTSETHMEYFTGIAGGSLTEGIGALATIILAIIGLAGVFADIVAPVAAIVIGAVFLMEGMSASAAIRRQNSHGTKRVPGMANGVTAGFRTGPAASPDVLLAVAVLAYGAALLVGSGTISRLTMAQDSFSAAAATSSGSMLVGLASVVLGILAIIGLVPITLVLVGLLCLGSGALFSGSSLNSETA